MATQDNLVNEYRNQRFNILIHVQAGVHDQSLVSSPNCVYQLAIPRG